jgi:hypothetical protein
VVSFRNLDTAAGAPDDLRTRRGRHLEQARPSCALTFDRYDDEWSRLAWVQVLGSAAVLAEGPVDALAARYVQYREHPPRGPFLRLTPDRALCWRAI